VCAVTDEVTRDTVLELLGSPGEDRLISLTDTVFDGDISGALLLLDRMLAEGRDERQLIKDWIEHFRNLMLLRYLERPEDMLNMSIENIERLREQCLRLTPAFVNDGIFALAGALNDARWSTRPRVLLEVGIIRMASPQSSAGAAMPIPAQVAKPAKPKSAQTAKPAPAVEPAPPAKPSASETPAPAEPIKLDWQSVIAEFKKKKSTLMRLDGHSRLAEIREGTFTVEVFDKFTKTVADDGREQIEAAVAGMVGTPLHMDCRLKEQAAEEQRPVRAAEPEVAEAPAPEAPWDEEAAQIQETLDFG
jgi:DNA polymerase-3 subunit gamma/tau